MPTHQRRALTVGAVLLAIAAAVALSQLHIVAEPLWLRRMNEFEHFVLHAAFWLVGVTMGSAALTAFLWSAFRLSAALRKRVVDPPAGLDARGARLTPRGLVLFALFLVATTGTLLAAQHGALPEPTWLARVTPFQHFLLHLGYILGGVIVAVAALTAWGRSLLDLLRRERLWDRNGQMLARRRRDPPGTAHRAAGPYDRR